MFSPSEPNTETEEEAGILVATVGSQAPKLMCFKGLAESEGFRASKSGKRQKHRQKTAIALSLRRIRGSPQSVKNAHRLS
jgi:hypothetical protein